MEDRDVKEMLKYICIHTQKIQRDIEEVKIIVYIVMLVIICNILFGKV